MPVLLVACGLASCGVVTGSEGRVENLFEARREGPDRLLELAPRALDDRSAVVRATAVWMLGETGRARVIGALARALNDPAPSVRAAALGALASFPHPGLASALTRLARDAEPVVRLRAIELLSACDPVGSADVFREAVGDADPDVRLAALRALAVGREDDPRTFARLVSVVLEDQDWRNRAAAVRSIARQKGSEADSILRLAAVDANPMVRAEAVRRIHRQARRPPRASRTPL